MAGTLVVVGSGIESVGHITLEAQGWIQRADKVLYFVMDPVTAAWIKKIAKPDSEPEDLMVYYTTPLTNTAVNAMAYRIAFWVEQGLNVCAVFYGHPGMLVHPAHRVTAWAGNQGIGRMLPGISALDCLFADLNVNPGDVGFQMFEAYDFLSRLQPTSTKPRPTLDPYCHVVLWEIGLIAQGYPPLDPPGYELQDLYDHLKNYYDDQQPIVHYQRPQLPMYAFQQPAQTLTLRDLPGLQGHTTGASTLYIAPKGYVDPDAAWQPDVQFSPATLGKTPMTLDAPNTALAPLLDILYTLAQDPTQLNNYVQGKQVVVNGTGVAPSPDASDITTLQNHATRIAVTGGQRGTDSLTPAVQRLQSSTLVDAYGLW